MKSLADLLWRKLCPEEARGHLFPKQTADESKWRHITFFLIFAQALC